MINSFIDDDISIIKSIDDIELISNENNIKSQEYSFDKNFELDDSSKNKRKENKKIQNIKFKNENSNNNKKIKLSFNPLLKLKYNYNNFSQKYINYNHAYLKSTHFSPVQRLNNKECIKISSAFFSCKYCKNDIIFKRLSNDIISKKYLFQMNEFDLKKLILLITYKFKSIKKYNNKNILFSIIVNNSEYLKKFYSNNKTKKYFNSNIFKNKCSENEITINNAFKYHFQYNIIKIKKLCLKKKKDNRQFKRSSSLNKLNPNDNKYKMDLLNKDKSNQKFKIKKNNFKIMEEKNINSENKKVFSFFGIDNLKQRNTKKDIEFEINYFAKNIPMINNRELMDRKEEEKKYIRITKLNIKKKVDDINVKNFIDSEDIINKNIEKKQFLLNNGSTHLLPIKKPIFKNDLKKILTPSNSTKNERVLDNLNKYSPYQRIRLKSINSRNEKNMMKNEKKKLTELIDINDKILFDYSTNIKNEFLKDCLFLKMNEKKDNMNKGNINSGQYYKKINSLNYHSKIDVKNNIDNIINETWKKENLRLTKKNYNPKNNKCFNNTLFNNSINKTKQTEIKYNSYKNNNIFNNSEQSNFNDRNKNINSFHYQKYMLLPNNTQFNMNVIK